MKDEHDDAALDEFLEALYRHRHYDFRHYARPSLRRRIGATKSILGCATLGSLAYRLIGDEDAFRAGLGVLTVPVSEMFRDPEFYVRMRERVVPELESYPSLKLWVAGCSAGEEALSIAVLLAEASLLDRALIYATDISPVSLERARSGEFALERLSSFEQSYRAAGGTRSLFDYVEQVGEVGKFSPELMSKIVFADHSLATDQVFSEVQVVTCRNVLIYFDKVLQARAVSLFKDALCRRGFLGLGPRETLRFSPHAHAFRELSSGNTWYQRC